jgi:hypothetical protein
VEADVLGHESQAEAGAVAGAPTAGGRTAEEPLEDLLPTFDGYPGAGIFDDQAHRGARRLDRQTGNASSVDRGVLDEIGEHALDAPLVDRDLEAGNVGGDLDGQRTVAAGLCCVLYQLVDADFVERQLSRSGVES